MKNEPLSWKIYRFWHLTIVENVRDWLFWSIPRDWKCLKYSIRHLRLNAICPECNGEGRYYNSYDMRDCGTCGTTGFVPVCYYHIEEFFHWHRIKIFIKGCKVDYSNNNICKRGTWGCIKHPLDKVIQKL